MHSFGIGPATVSMECDGHSSDILVGVLSFYYKPGPPVTPLSNQPNHLKVHQRKIRAADRFQSGYLQCTSVFKNRKWICKTIGERNTDLCWIRNKCIWCEIQSIAVVTLRMSSVVIIHNLCLWYIIFIHQIRGTLYQYIYTYNIKNNIQALY